MKLTKLPAQIYVTSREMHDHDYIDGKWVVVNTYKFGFLHPHEPNKKTDAKRKELQKKWAYGRYEEVDGKVVSLDWTYNHNGKEYTKLVIPEEHQPAILDNVPLTGFKIIDTVSRYSTGNKLVKVLDPRGFVFEITIASLFGIIQDGSIINAVIQEPCVWLSNKNLITWKG